MESASEVAEALGSAARALGVELALRLEQLPSAPATGARPASVSEPGDADRRRLLDVLGHDPLALDELAARTGHSAAELSSMLLMLELEGSVEGLPGGRYQRLPGA